MAEASINISCQDDARALFGPQDEYLRQVRSATDANIVLRGNEIRVFGTQAQVSDCCQILNGWQSVLFNNGKLLQSDVKKSLDPDVNETTTQRLESDALEVEGGGALGACDRWKIGPSRSARAQRGPCGPSIGERRDSRRDRRLPRVEVQLD